MLNTTTLSDYLHGLRTFLNLCEKSYGPKGQPSFLVTSNGTDVELTKNTRLIFQYVESSSNNPLVKIAARYALDQIHCHCDHGLYVVIVALNAYLRLTVETVPIPQLVQELHEMETIIEHQMTHQSGFHSIFETNFEFLVQLSTNIIAPKLFGFTSSKLNSFSKFVVSALIQSIHDPSTMEAGSWLEPKVLLLPMVGKDHYTYGEIYEGLLFPIKNMEKTKKYLQRVIELRSFKSYELLYSETTKLNSVLLNYDQSKFWDSVVAQVILHEKFSLPSMKLSIVETYETNFVCVLEKSNIGVVFSENELISSLRSKLSDCGIFVLESVSARDIVQASRVFEVEVMTSLHIEDAESYRFQIEKPTLRTFRGNPYLAISKTRVVVLILYILLDSCSKIDEALASLVFNELSKLIFLFYKTDKQAVKQRMLCHGAGCTEMLLAGIMLRIGDNDRSSSTFWMSKNTDIHNTIKQCMANSLIKIWQLTHEAEEDKKLFNDVCGPLNFCRHNLSCVCRGTRGIFGTVSSQVLDITEVKCAALMKAIRLLKTLLKTDAVMLVK